MEKCYKCGKDAAPGRFIKVEDGWTREGYHWYAACEECYAKYGEGVHHVIHEIKMVTKTEIFCRPTHNDLVEIVNEFISDKYVLDIQYKPVPEYNSVYHYAMIVYQEEE